MESEKNIYNLLLSWLNGDKKKKRKDKDTRPCQYIFSSVFPDRETMVEVLRTQSEQEDTNDTLSADDETADKKEMAV